MKVEGVFFKANENCNVRNVCHNCHVEANIHKWGL